LKPRAVLEYGFPRLTKRRKKGNNILLGCSEDSETGGGTDMTSRNMVPCSSLVFVLCCSASSSVYESPFKWKCFKVVQSGGKQLLLARLMLYGCDWSAVRWQIMPRALLERGQVKKGDKSPASRYEVDKP
ncbi:hypothetical protein CRG98_039630, partial [Punica granatum]